MKRACKRNLHEYDRLDHTQCPECLSLAKKFWNENNPEKVLKHRREEYLRHRDKYLIKFKEQSNRRNESAAYREQERLRKRSWKKNNLDKHAAQERARTASKMKRTPPWLTVDHFIEMAAFYALAKELQWLSEDSLEVDHIVPLQGENVSGLHVPWNLQILSQSENCKKSNKLLGGGLSEL